MSTLLRAAALTGCLLLTGTLHAQPGPPSAAAARAVNGRLGAVTVTLESGAAGWRLRGGGLELALGAGNGGAAPRLHNVRGAGVEALWVHLPTDAAHAREVVLAPAAGGRLHSVLDVTTGPEGEDGEQSRHLALVSGHLWTWSSATQVWRCDRAPVHLFARRLEMAAGQPRFVARPWPGDPAGPGATAARGPVLVAEPLGGPDRPALSGFRAVAASSTAGETHDAGLVRPPAEVSDGRPTTSWVAGGGSRFEWVTLTGDAGSYHITEVVLVPGHGQSAAQLAAHARPRVGRLIFGGAAGAANSKTTTVRFRLPDDPAGRPPGTAYRIRLPRPLASACLTVQLDEVQGGRAGVALGEVTPHTDVEAAGFARLLEALGQGGSPGLAAARLLRRGGAAAARVLAAALDRLSPEGRKLAVGVLADAPTPEAAAPLCQALLAAGQAGDAATQPDLVRALRVHGQPAASCLAGLLERPALAEPTRLAAIQLLGELPGDVAVKTLRARLGMSPRPVRLALLKAARQQPAARMVPALLEDLDRGGPAARADRWTLLGTLASHHAGLTAPAVNRLLPLLGSGALDQVRLAALASAGDLLAAAGTGAALEQGRSALARLAAQDPSPVVRALAVRASGRLGRPATATLLAGLSDRDPRVREVAVDALARGGLATLTEAEQGRVVNGFRDERWPRVRRRLAEALAQLCRKGGGQPASASGDAAARAALLAAFDHRPADAYEVRHATALGLEECGDPGLQPRLARVLADPREPIGLRQQAVGLYAQLAGRGGIPVLGQALDRSLSERRREQGELIAAALARALGGLHDQHAVPYLWRSLIQPAPEVRAALASALGELCHQRSKKALTTLSQDPDLLVKRSATLALEQLSRCKEPQLPLP
jgi:HEAT repeat protein